MKLCTPCWWLALAAFAGLGMIRWSQFFIPSVPDLQNPDAGLDAIASRHLALDHGAAVLRRELATFPPDAPLLVVGPGKDWSLTEAHYLISYLAWPRPVWCIGLGAPGEKSEYDSPPPPGLKPAALFFYKTGSPPGLPVHRLSERLSVEAPTP